MENMLFGRISELLVSVVLKCVVFSKSLGKSFQRGNRHAINSALIKRYSDM